MIDVVSYLDYLENWVGTPYAHGRGACKIGTDCIHFVCAVLDYLHGFDARLLDPIPILPADATTHDPEAGAAYIRFVVNRYDLEVVWRRGISDQSTPDTLLRSGDVLCISYGPSPCHALIAGPLPISCYHAMPSYGTDKGGCVVATSLGWCLGKGLSRIWRSPHI